jgi:hypothetical protein
MTAYTKVSASLRLAAAALLVAVAGTVLADAPPFTLDIKPVAVGQPLPGLHSYALGETTTGEWLIVGGRTNGLHLFVQSSEEGTKPPPNAFPPEHANDRAWVIDPKTGASATVGLDDLSAPVRDQLSATNAQSVQDGDTLYIIGGYGKDSATGLMTTFRSLIAIEVGPAAAAVKASQSIAPFVQQTDVFVDCPTEGTNSYSICFRALSGECNKGEGWAACQEQAAATCRKVQHGVELRCGQAFRQGGAGEQPTPNLNLAVTGGGLLKLGDTFFLVFGQQFEGMYSVDESDYGKWPTLQRYTEQVVALAIEPKPLAAAILYYLQQDPADPARQFHRRDLNVLPALNPATGTPRIAVHGGVFVPGEFNGFQSPILLDAIDEPAPAAITSVQTGFAQKTSLYESATASVVIGLDQMGSAMGQTRMMQILIGGIGVYDIQDGKLQAEEGLPFTHNLTVVSQDVTWQGGAPADTRWTEYVRAAQLDSYMGTDAHFVPDPALSMSTKGGVISLDGVDKPVLLGHVFGGILADAPQSGGNSPTTNKTSASNALYEVWLTPGTAPAGYWVDAADAAAATGLDKSFGSVKKRAAGGP